MRLAPERDPLSRQLAGVFVAMAALGALALRWRPDLLLGLARCPLRDITGIPCPTCGGTHAAAALARLDLAGALTANPLVVVAAAALAAWAAWALGAAWRPGWRVRLEVSARERRLLRVAAVGAAAGFWAWQVARLG